LAIVGFVVRFFLHEKEIDPDRRPPLFAPSDRRSPPRLPQDFHHGLL
jgi:hypothetical protein